MEDKFNYLDESEFEQDCRIDETALDVEWLEQPNLMFKYLKKLELAKAELARLKEEMELLKADLDKDIRLHPKRHGLSNIPKITEAVITGAILKHQEYKDKAREIIEASYEVGVTKASVASIEQRKEGLQDLVKLHGQRYFAGPKVPRNLRNEAEKRRDIKRSNDLISIPRRSKKIKRTK